MRKTSKRKVPSQIVSVRLPAATSARVAKLAAERNQTVSEVIRAAIDDLESTSPFLRVSGVFDSGVADLSTSPAHLKHFGK